MWFLKLWDPRIIDYKWVIFWQVLYTSKQALHLFCIRMSAVSKVYEITICSTSFNKVYRGIAKFSEEIVKLFWLIYSVNALLHVYEGKDFSCQIILVDDCRLKIRTSQLDISTDDQVHKGAIINKNKRQFLVGDVQSIKKNYYIKKRFWKFLDCLRQSTDREHKTYSSSNTPTRKVKRIDLSCSLLLRNISTISSFVFKKIY